MWQLDATCKLADVSDQVGVRSTQNDTDAVVSLAMALEDLYHTVDPN